MSQQDFANRVIIVTGGTGGVGRAVAQALLERGAQVVVTYINKQELQRLQQYINADDVPRLMAVEVDIFDIDAVGKFVTMVMNQLHRIDGLVNLVGGYSSKSFLDMTWSDWQQSMTLNLHSAWLMTKAVVPHMVEAGYGRIVSVGSRGAIQAAPNASHYNAAKVGLMWFMESIGNELKEYNITANTVLPSVIDTEVNRQLMPDADFSHWVRPDEVAEAICYLASDKASGTSGAKIPLYGKA